MRPVPTACEASTEIRSYVTENDKTYKFRAEVPGAKRGDIDITIDGNYVSITTEVKRETEETSGSATRALVRELYYGSLARLQLGAACRGRGGAFRITGELPSGQHRRDGSATAL